MKKSNKYNSNFTSNVQGNRNSIKNIQGDHFQNCTFKIDNNNSPPGNYIEKKKTSLKEIASSKLLPLLISIVVTILTQITNTLLPENYSTMPQLIFKIVLWIATFIFGLLVIFIVADYINIITLRKSGKFVEFLNKPQECLRILSSIFNSSTSPIKERKVGKCYKNIDNNIYEVLTCKCSRCQTSPIGTMNLFYIDDGRKKGYYFKCNEKPEHMIEFDYKSNF